MKSGRLEAFSDGVLAIIITIMVLSLAAPEKATWGALTSIFPSFLSYLLSFIYVGIYWNNHHHLFQVTERVNGKVLWGNLHLLLWLSLIPFVTSWVGVNHLAPLPVALYGFVLFMAAVAWRILQITLSGSDKGNERLGIVVKGGPKEVGAIILYAAGIGLAFISVWISIAIYAGIAVIWVVPERRIE